MIGVDRVHPLGTGESFHGDPPDRAAAGSGAHWQTDLPLVYQIIKTRALTSQQVNVCMARKSLF